MNIKPITLKPITPGQSAAPSAPAAAAPAAPAPAAPAPAAPAAPAPAAAAPSGIKPITIKPISLNPGAAKGMTLGDGASSATIRMTPVPAAARPAPAPAPAAPAPAASAPKGIRPISIKPPPPVAAPDVTAQAIKGKTSRISLDSALATPPPAGAAPAMGRITSNLSAVADAAKGQTMKVPAAALAADAGSQQTIRLQKPPAPSPAPAAPAAAPAAPAKAPAPAADSAAEAPTVKRKPLSLKTPGSPAPAAPGAGEDSKPTLRLKTAGGPAAAKKPAVKSPSAAPEAPKTGTAMGADIEAPPSAFGNAPVAAAKKEKTGVLFPIVAAAAVVALATLSLLLASEACGPDEGSLTQFSSFRGLPSIQIIPRYVSR